MTSEQHEKYPVGRDFLALLQETGDSASKVTDEFMKNGGKSFRQLWSV